MGQSVNLRMQKEINMNFGKWIVVAFVLFGGFIATLVTICVHQDISLVSKDYYKEELEYQKQIVRINNTANLESKPIVRISGQTITVEFNQSSTIDGGVLKLYCPSNPKMDRAVKLQFSNQTMQPLKVDILKKGMYRTKLFWTMNGKGYYQEDVINI